jgi:DnaJ-class molecular chaperone
MTIPAVEHKRICWNENKLFLGTLKNADLEDSKGFYSILGCSKVSSDACIVESFDKAKTAYHNHARTHYPDKSKGNKAMLAEFMEGKNVYEQQKVTFDFFGMANVYGDVFPSQVDYDRAGEDLRDQFLLHLTNIPGQVLP